MPQATDNEVMHFINRIQDRVRIAVSSILLVILICSYFVESLKDALIAGGILLAILGVLLITKGIQYGRKVDFKQLTPEEAQIRVFKGVRTKEWVYAWTGIILLYIGVIFTYVISVL